MVRFLYSTATTLCYKQKVSWFHTSLFWWFLIQCLSPTYFKKWQRFDGNFSKTQVKLLLNQFSQLIDCYIPWERQKTKDLTFSRSIEMEHGAKTGSSKKLFYLVFLILPLTLATTKEYSSIWKGVMLW